MTIYTDINKIANLQPLDTTVVANADGLLTLKVNMTTEQNIILNMVISCISTLHGEMANSKRMVNRLGSLSVLALDYADNNRINIPFAYTVDADEIKQPECIRLGRRSNGKWFIFATCIAELGLPVSYSSGMRQDGNANQERLDMVQASQALLEGDS
jgi:hypothetical protein